jgi:hypothetical protein
MVLIKHFRIYHLKEKKFNKELDKYLEREGKELNRWQYKFVKAFSSFDNVLIIKYKKKLNTRNFKHIMRFMSATFKVVDDDVDDLMISYIYSPSKFWGWSFRKEDVKLKLIHSETMHDYIMDEDYVYATYNMDINDTV